MTTFLRILIELRVNVTEPVNVTWLKLDFWRIPKKLCSFFLRLTAGQVIFTLYVIVIPAAPFRLRGTY